MRKKMIALLLAFASALWLTVPVCAAELPDENRYGSMTILTEFEGEPLEGGALTIVRVGRVHIDDGNAGFVLVDALAGGPALDKLGDPALAFRLLELALEKNLPTVRSEMKEGRTVFSDLEIGLYLVYQEDEDAAAGFDAIHPFLLSLPQWINETYLYDLTASPKVPLETEPTEPTESTEPPPEPSEPPDLPQTGQLNWPVPVLTVLGLSFFATGWILCFRDRRNRHEA